MRSAGLAELIQRGGGGQCFEWGVRVSLSRYSGVGGGSGWGVRV